MNEQILGNIHSLYRSYIVTAIIFFVLILSAILVTIGVLKLNVVKLLAGKIALVATVIICSVFIVISQIVSIAPIYKDFHCSSYIIVENATVVIKGDSTGVLSRTSTASVSTKDEGYELKIQTDFRLDSETEYIGTIVFLKNSKHIVWYEFNR